MMASSGGTGAHRHRQCCADHAASQRRTRLKWMKHQLNLIGSAIS
jgi:hypothetical protein